MNTNLIFVLHCWQPCIHTNNIDIDWPAVHKVIGADKVSWITSQPKTHCQLIVEKINMEYRLILEFYNIHSARAYQGLMN